jgi:DNA-binding transcriptional MerR regulator
MPDVKLAEAIKQWRTWSSGSVDELAAIGTAFVWALGLEPLPGTAASATVNRRTIRYYISSQLMDPPDGERRLAIYHQRHLLQLIYIKARQHAGDRLREIRADLKESDRESLEALVIQALPETVPEPVPVDPSEFARPADLNAVLRRWAYLTGRQGRFQGTGSEKQQESRAAESIRVGPAEKSGPPGVRVRAEMDLGEDLSLVLPADHPLVHDEDGQALFLRGVRRLLRNYRNGGGPAEKER